MLSSPCEALNSMADDERDMRKRQRVLRCYSESLTIVSLLVLSSLTFLLLGAGSV